jgi:hypothetical protein
MDTGADDDLFDMRGSAPSDPRFRALTPPGGVPSPWLSPPSAAQLPGEITLPAARAERVALGLFIAAFLRAMWFTWGALAERARMAPVAAPVTAPAPAALPPVVAPVVAPVVDSAPVRTDLYIRALPDGTLALVAPYIRGADGYTARPALKAATGAEFLRGTPTLRAAGLTEAWVVPAGGLAAARAWLMQWFGYSGGSVQGTTASLTDAPAAPAVAPVPTASERQAIPAATITAAVVSADATSAAIIERARSRRAATPPPVAAGNAALAALDAALGGNTMLTETRADVGEVNGATLRAGELVAGARTDGQGVLVGWTGRKERTRSQIIAALAAAGAPSDWAPKSKSAHAHAGNAVMRLSREGLIPRMARDVNADDRRRGVAARWIVGRANFTGDVGDAMGRIALTAELVNSDLRLDGDPALCAEVREEYNRRADADVYGAADVTAWLSGVLREHLGAVRLAQAWYVRNQHATVAERLCQVIADGDKSIALTGWGCDWLLPALPVATSKQLRTGLARGFITEATDVLDELEAAQKVARDAGRTGIGTRAAATLLGKLRTVSERAAQYMTILGAEALGDIRVQIRAALDVVEPLCDDTSQRGALLELDDAPRDSGARRD